MANNYTQFSEQIDELPAEAIAWLYKVTTFNAEDDYAGSEEAEAALKKLLCSEDLPCAVEDWGCMCDVDIDDDAGSVWFSAGERGDLEQLAYIIHGLIKQFIPSYVFSLTYSETCSKPRLGEFGGGCMVIAKGEIRSWSAYAQAKEFVKELSKTQ